jgi:hypothetical protein
LVLEDNPQPEAFDPEFFGLLLTAHAGARARRHHFQRLAAC